MKRRLLAAAFLLLPTGAMAADITVFSPGVTGGGIRKLAMQWSLETGNRVNIVGGTIGMARNFALSDREGDIVLLPPDEMARAQPSLTPGSAREVGRALFGLVVKAGKPHPDISTVRKFADALRKGGGIGHPDPAAESLSGIMVDAMVKRPEFKGVVNKAFRMSAPLIVINDQMPFAGGTISEELSNPAAELVGPFPAELNMFIDFQAASLARSKAPADAAHFLAFITRPEAMAAWHDCGIDGAGQDVNGPRQPCAVAAPTIAAPPGNDEVRAPRPARAKGISAAQAVEAAQAANAQCLASGYRTTTLVTDSAGAPIVMLSNDGAAAITQRIAMGKAQTVIRHGVTSGEMAARAAKDAALMAQMEKDSMTGPPRQGAIPIRAGTELLGAIAVSGAPGGDRDEPCAIAGLAKIQNQLK